MEVPLARMNLSARKQKSRGFKTKTKKSKNRNKTTIKDRLIKGVVITTENWILSDNTVRSQMVSTILSSKGHHFLPYCIETLTNKPNTDFDVLMPDVFLYLTTVYRPITGSVSPSMETILATFNRSLKRAMDTEYGVNFKLWKDQRAVYNKNTKAAYSVAHGNIGGVVIRRCKLDNDYVAFHA